jgi:large subunit ribosomal protein L2
MGKRLIQQARGKGGPTYRAPSFRYKGVAKHLTIQSESTFGIVLDIIHCAGHSAPLAKVRYEDGQELFLVAAEGICVGDKVSNQDPENLTVGSTLELDKIPEGTAIFNIEAQPGDGGKFARGSGVFAKVLTKVKGKVIVQLPSKKKKQFSPKCRANIGVVAGGGRLEKPLMKAGTAYYKYKAKNKLWPIVSGTSMNAVDHPFGKASSHTKGRSHCTSKDAPKGRKVGKIGARQTGQRKGRSTKISKGGAGKRKKENKTGKSLKGKK